MQEFTDGKSVSLPAQIQQLADNVGDIEVRLRTLIASVANDDWKLIPDNERIKADERIDTELRSNPGMDRVPLETVVGRLAYCDLRALEQIIMNKLLWPEFADAFGTKESLTGRFQQLTKFRNAKAHLRDTGEVTLLDAEAAVLWFNAALSRVEQEGQAPVDLPIEEDEDFEGLPDSIAELETV